MMRRAVIVEGADPEHAGISLYGDTGDKEEYRAQECIITADPAGPAGYRRTGRIRHEGDTGAALTIRDYNDRNSSEFLGGCATGEGMSAFII